VIVSCETIISNKDSSIPRSTIHPLSNSDDPQGRSQGVNNREWMDRMCRDEATTRCFPCPRAVTRDPLRR